MKTNFLTYALMAIIVALVVYIFNMPKQQIENENTNQKKTISSDFSNEESSVLDVSLIHNMVNNYKNNQLAHIKEFKKEDAHSIWFDLVTLKKFIYQIETNALKNDNDANIDKLGIRMYYAAYPNKDDFKNFKDLEWMLDKEKYNNYNNLHTLVMIPTIKTSVGNVDFNPLDTDTFTKYGLKNKSKIYGNPNGKVSNQPVNKATFGFVSASIVNEETMALNHGSLIPPADPTHEAF